jgi:hypothetical protein
VNQTNKELLDDTTGWILLPQLPDIDLSWRCEFDPPSSTCKVTFSFQKCWLCQCSLLFTFYILAVDRTNSLFVFNCLNFEIHIQRVNDRHYSDTGECAWYSECKGSYSVYYIDLTLLFVLIRHFNGHRKGKNANNDIQNITQKTKDWSIWIPQKTGRTWVLQKRELLSVLICDTDTL